MGIDKRYKGIDEYAVMLIKYRARQLIGRVGFVESDREDLEQDMMLDLFQRMPKYDPNRANRNTFIARVVDHRVATIVKAREAGIRDYRVCSYSLNSCARNKHGGFAKRIETVDQERYRRHMGSHSLPLSELDGLSIDLRKAIENLPCDLRALCGVLCTSTVSEISRETGIGRDAIYDGIKKLRSVFEDAGLKDYL